jgi:hypothetical protein
MPDSPAEINLGRLSSSRFGAVNSRHAARCPTSTTASEQAGLRDRTQAVVTA